MAVPEANARARRARPQSHVPLRPRPRRRPGSAEARSDGRQPGGRDPLPREAGARAPEPRPAPQGERAGRRVLVVDDEPSIRLLCSVNLDVAGYEVVEAETGLQALELAASGGFDLVLLDVMLPDLGGYEVARRLAQEAAKAPPVAFLSARAERADLRAGYEAGGVDYITKPFDPIALTRRVAEIIDRVGSGEGERYRRRRIAELSE